MSADIRAVSTYLATAKFELWDSPLTLVAALMSRFGLSQRTAMRIMGAQLQNYPEVYKFKDWPLEVGEYVL